MLFDKQLHSKNILYVANNPELPSKFRNEMFDILSNKDTMKYLSVYPDMKFLLNDIEVRHQRNISHQSANYVMLVEEGHKRPLVKGKTKFDENGFPLEVDHFTLIGVIGLPRLNLEKKESEVGIILHQNYEGKGYAKESIYFFLNLAFSNYFDLCFFITSKDNLSMKKWCQKNLKNTSESSVEGKNWVRFCIKKEDFIYLN